MTTHVFIVDSTTFKLHLEYLFAGTGAKNYKIDFNGRASTRLPGKTENLLVAMIADASRIRKGDFIIFYLQQKISQKIFEGKFYGIFKAKHDWSFLDHNDQNQYLKNELSKSLTFRTMIEPHKVYAEGVTEWEALDEIKNIQSPNQMLWSLIYRKLKGNRGNTMITTYESRELCKLIQKKNRGCQMCCDNRLLSFDLETQSIICLNKRARSYAGRNEPINVVPRLLRKLREDKSFEPHLQAYIVKNIGKRLDPGLDTCILGKGIIEWIGNEVSCGVGMQRIDVLLSIINGRRRTVVPIELKTHRANDQCAAQMQRYVNWLEQYYVPNCQSYIQPMLLCRKIAQKTKASGSPTSRYERIIASFHAFNEANKRRRRKLKYVEFSIENGNLIFDEVSY